MFDAAGWVVVIVKDARAVVLRRPQWVTTKVIAGTLSAAIFWMRLEFRRNFCRLDADRRVCLSTLNILWRKGRRAHGGCVAGNS